MNELFNQWDVVVILLQIIAIDLLLGGDNAVVIAMACRKLPPEQRTKAIIIGTFGAILARVLLLAIAVYLLSLPWLKIVGALLLLWIGIKQAACGGPRSPSRWPMLLCRWITCWRSPPPGKATCCWSRWAY